MQHKYGYVFKELPINQVAHDEDQPRQDFGVEGDTNRLLKSIEQHGIENVIVVSEQEPGYYVIIDGHRRHLCAQKLGFETIPCRVYPKMTQGELEARRYEIQNNRRSWKPLERAEALERIKINKGFDNNKDLADYLGASETAIANSLQLQKLKSGYRAMLERYNFNPAFSTEFIRLKPKLRKVKNYEIATIIQVIFDRVGSGVIKNSKDLRTLGSIFRRATANEEELVRFLDDPDMTVQELEQRTLQSGFSLHIEELIQAIAKKKSTGIAFSSQEKAFLEQLKNLLDGVA